MGQFTDFNAFLAMDGHGLYVWLSYGITLLVIIYNISSAALKKRRFFIDAKRRLRREKQQS